MISAENISEMEKMIEFSERLMPKFVYFHNINPFGSDKFTALSTQNEYSMKHLNKILKRNDYAIDIQTTHIFNEKSSHFTETKCSLPWNNFSFNSKMPFGPYLIISSILIKIFNNPIFKI